MVSKAFSRLACKYASPVAESGRSGSPASSYRLLSAATRMSRTALNTVRSTSS